MHTATTSSAHSRMAKVGWRTLRDISMLSEIFQGGEVQIFRLLQLNMIVVEVQTDIK